MKLWKLWQARGFTSLRVNVHKLLRSQERSINLYERLYHPFTRMCQTVGIFHEAQLPLGTQSRLLCPILSRTSPAPLTGMTEKGRSAERLSSVIIIILKSTTSDAHALKSTVIVFGRCQCVPLPNISHLQKSMTFVAPTAMHKAAQSRSTSSFNSHNKRQDVRKSF